MNPNLIAALEYARRGWAVFPLHGIVEKDGVLTCTCRNPECEDAGKHPLTRQGVKDASTSEAAIYLWFIDEETNVAIATGEKSGITILDIDVGSKGGDATWAELTKDSGEPETLMSQTGSGGLHIFFKYNSVLPSSTNTLGRGIDCRNDGGYIVAPPSRHRKGARYEWLNEFPIADLPSFLSRRGEKEKKAKTKNRKSYSLSDIRQMLEKVSSEDRGMWRSVGIILGREFDRSEDAWNLYNEWSDKWEGEKGRNHDTIMHEAFYELSQEEGDLSVGTIVRAALESGWAPKTGSGSIDNFIYSAPSNKFIYRPTRAEWEASAVDAAVSPVNHEGEIVLASVWIRTQKLITSVTSDPLIKDEIVREHDCLDGIIMPSPGGSLYNKYRPPTIELGNPDKCEPWLNHVRKIFNKPGDADQFLDYMAHRVQFPGIKPRFALVLVGPQGLGKDTVIQFCAPALGEWNVTSIAPKQVDTDFNEYVAKVLVIVSEAADQHDMSKWSFNEKMKVVIAGTPDHMTVNPKFGHKFSVRMHCGIIITTNHISALYIPNDDRRYDVINCPTPEEIGLGDETVKWNYYEALWNWYLTENGARHIAAFLHARDLSKFRPATGQRKTVAHREIISSGHDVDAWFSDAMGKLGNPAVVTAELVWEAVKADPDQNINQKDLRSRIGYVLPRNGYVRCVNEDRIDGRWATDGKATSVFYNPKMIDLEGVIAFIRQGRMKREAF